MLSKVNVSISSDPCESTRRSDRTTVLVNDMAEDSGGLMVTLSFEPIASGSLAEPSAGLTDTRKVDHSGTVNGGELIVHPERGSIG